MQQACFERFLTGVPTSFFNVTGQTGRRVCYIKAGRPCPAQPPPSPRCAKHAGVEGTDPDETAEVQPVASVAPMTAYLGRRMGGGRGYMTRRRPMARQCARADYSRGRLSSHCW